jgi:transposase
MTPRPAPAYLLGLDVGSTQCSYALLRADKTPVGKPHTFANNTAGFAELDATLVALAVPTAQILIGLEATSLYWENLYYFLVGRGYRVLLLHPAQTHQYAAQRGLRAKTDQLDATTIARLLASEDLRPAYVPAEQVVAYRELVRLHTRLSKDAARYKIQIRGLVSLLFPEFTQLFRNPGRPTARALLHAYPSARAVVAAGVDAVAACLQQLGTRRYGRATAERLVALAAASAASGVAGAARERSLRILVDQLGHTQEQLCELEAALAELVGQDAGARSLASVPEFGPLTVAVVRAELGDVTRFERSDQAVAYVGLDVTVRQSGKSRGQRKVSKRGSGAVRRILYLAAVHSLTLPGSSFRAYYQHLVDKGVAKMSALMAVMRKMLTVAYRLLRVCQVVCVNDFAVPILEIAPQSESPVGCGFSSS